MSREPSDAEVISAAIDARLLDLHTCIPGNVVSYDAAKQVADVQPVVMRAVLRDDGSRIHEKLPVLPNVPIVWPRGGGYALRWNLDEGDSVLVIFSEAATSQWRESGSVSEPGDLRRHDLSYSFAIPGIAPASIPLTPIVADEAVFDVSGHLRVGGLTADFVALAAKVDAQLSALKSAIVSAAATESGASGLGGMTALNTELAAWPLVAGTAATKLKAE